MGKQKDISYDGLARVLTESLNKLAREDGYFDEDPKVDPKPEVEVEDEYITHISELDGLQTEVKARIIADALLRGERIKKVI